MAYQIFDQPLKQLDYQYLGFFAVLGLFAFSIYSGADLVTGALGTLVIMMGRHLYRNSIKKES